MTDPFSQIARKIKTRTAVRGKTELAQITDLSSLSELGFVWVARGSSLTKVLTRTLDVLVKGDWVYVRKMTGDRTAFWVYDSFGVHAKPDGTMRYQPEYRAPFVLLALWHGFASQIPHGWYACDGTNAAVDLSDCFVAGTDAMSRSFGLGQSGSHPVLTHDHGQVDPTTTLTSVEFAHRHQAHVPDYTIPGFATFIDATDFNFAPFGIGVGPYLTDEAGDPLMFIHQNGHKHYVDEYLSAGTQAHAHALTVDGGLVPTTVTLDVRPPWYSLLYMQTSVSQLDLLPEGVIIGVLGLTNVALPPDVLVCNGQPGTPDLRDRFLVGAGSLAAGEANTVTTDVSDTVTLTHTHPSTITALSASHVHTYTAPVHVSMQPGTTQVGPRNTVHYSSNPNPLNQYNGGCFTPPHDHTLMFNGLAADHAHDLAAADTWEDQATITLKPSGFSLIFVKKVAS